MGGGNLLAFWTMGLALGVMYRASVALIVCSCDGDLSHVLHISTSAIQKRRQKR